MLNTSMATRAVSGGLSLENTTEYCLHKSQRTIFAGIQHKIVDYSEHRLLRYAAGVTDAQQKLVLIALLSDYCGGKVAIAWHRGLPRWLRITQDKNVNAGTVA